MSIDSVMSSNHLILCHSLLLLPSIFPRIRVFPSESVLCIRWPKYWASASASLLLMNIQDWFPLWLTGLISLQSKRLSRVFSNTTVQNHQFFSALCSLWFNSYIHTWPQEKNIVLTRRTFVGKVMSLLLFIYLFFKFYFILFYNTVLVLPYMSLFLNMLSRLVINFLPRSKRFFSFMAAVTICSGFGAPKIKSATLAIASHLFPMKWWDRMPWS